MSFADKFDQGIFGKILNAIVHDGPDMIGRGIGHGIGKALDGLADVHDAVVAGIGTIITGSKDMMPALPSATVEAPKIEASQAAQMNAHEVHPSELFTFAAPTFGGQAASQGASVKL